MARSRVGRVQLTTILEDDRAKRRTLRQGQPLPDRFEQRLLFREQPGQRRVQVVNCRAPRAGRADIVPRLVREALDVVGKVARDVDDGGAEARFWFDAALRE